MCAKMEYPVIAVTNRRLCKRPLPLQMERLKAAGVQAVILREKDLSEEDYAALAAELLSAGERLGLPVILHSFWKIAEQLECKSIHLPLPILRENPALAGQFARVGTSVHSLAGALEAERLGASYLTAGHIFPTQCKPGLAPRGLSFLEEICRTVSVPVYGIGGIHAENIREVMQSGAAGVCMMSEMMNII